MTNVGYDNGDAGSSGFFGEVKEYANGIYRLTSSTYWWLASPSNNSGLLMRYVNDYDAIVGNSGLTGNNYARPVVCIPVSNFSAEMIIGD